MPFSIVFYLAFAGCVVLLGAFGLFIVLSALVACMRNARSGVSSCLSVFTRSAAARN